VQLDPRISAPKQSPILLRLKDWNDKAAQRRMDEERYRLLQFRMDLMAGMTVEQAKAAEAARA
jgi:hypothetical protein